MTADPILVEVTRGNLVESTHRGAFVVSDDAGAVIAEGGDIDRPVFPRSAVKLIQALPLVESGAADAFGFGDRELAMACASHSGEPGHVVAAEAMLRAAGLGEDALECGAHWPFFKQDVLIEFARTARDPSQLHNNCSGKHAGFLCACAHAGHGPEGYVHPRHPMMEEVRGALEALTGVPHREETMGIDGCGAPNWAAPLRSLATAFARLGSGRGLERERFDASRRLMAASMSEPWHVAGTGRFDTRLMEAAPGLVHSKTGAEGVYCASVPGEGIGIALKIADGTTRASEIAIAAIVGRVLGDRGRAVAALSQRTLRNWNGREVGELRPTEALGWP